MINRVIWYLQRICSHTQTSPSPMRKSDKLMNYWENGGRQTKSKSHATQSLLHPICSQRIPPKIDSLLTRPDTLCEGERKLQIRDREWRTGGSICQEYEQRHFTGQVPTVVILPLTKKNCIRGLEWWHFVRLKILSHSWNKCPHYCHNEMSEKRAIRKPPQEYLSVHDTLIVWQRSKATKVSKWK